MVVKYLLALPLLNMKCFRQIFHLHTILLALFFPYGYPTKGKYCKKKKKLPHNNHRLYSAIKIADVLPRYIPFISHVRNLYGNFPNFYNSATFSNMLKKSSNTLPVHSLNSSYRQTFSMAST